MKEKQYVAINFYGNDVWVEFTSARSYSDAEFELARNNPQIILSEDEVRKVFGEIKKRIDL